MDEDELLPVLAVGLAFRAPVAVYVESDCDGVEFWELALLLLAGVD